MAESERDISDRSIDHMKRGLREHLDLEEGIHDLPAEAEKALKEGKEQIGSYLLINGLGSGGSGMVYKAFDVNLKRFVALKLLNSFTDRSNNRIRREAETIAALKHDNIVDVYEVGEFEGRCYIAMQYIEGVSLDKAIASLTTDEMLRLMLKVCDAVRYAHSCGIIHRDIKPQNIMLTKEGEVYLVDFGLARHVDALLSWTSEFAGTPEYMAPEQLDGHAVDEKTDIYSIGATLYTCFTGKAPFQGASPLEILKRMATSDPLSSGDITSKLPGNLVDIVRKSMSRDPDSRYQSVTELIRDIQGALSGASRSKRSVKIIYWGLIALPIMAGVVFLWLPAFNGTGRVEPDSSGNQGGENPALATRYYERGKEYFRVVKYTRDENIRKKMQELYAIAIESFDKAIEFDPGLTEAYLYRGELQYRRGRYGLAIKDFLSVLKNNNAFAEAYYLSIMSYLLLLAHHPSPTYRARYTNSIVDRSELALRSLEKLDAAKYKVLCANAAISIMKNMVEQDEEMRTERRHYISNVLREAKTHNPAFVDSYMLTAINIWEIVVSIMGLIQDGTGEVTGYSSERVKNFTKLAHGYFQKVIELDPNLDMPYGYCAMIHYLNRDFDKALDEIAEAIMLNPSDNNWIPLKAEIYIGYGDTAKAVDTLNEGEAAIYNSGNNNKALFYLKRGTLFLRLKKVADAEEDFEAALSLTSDDLKAVISKDIAKAKKLYLHAD